MAGLARWTRWLLIGGGMLLAGCNSEDPRHLAVTGQIEGVGVDVGSRVGGRVQEVLVEEGASVKAGDVLVRLEADEAQAVVAAAKAQLASTTAVLEKLQAGAREEDIRQAEAAVQQAEERYQLALKGARSQEIQAARALADSARAQRDDADAEFQRAERLHAGNAASEQVYDRAKHAREAAAGQYQAAREKLDLLVQGSRSEEIGMAKAARDQVSAALDELRHGARPEDIRTAQAARDAAAADLARAETALKEMTIAAPGDGVVASLDVHPGDLVKPGGFARLVDPEDLELMVYVSALALGYLQLGQQVALTSDAHGEERFQGTIAQIATQGEYTPRNLQTKEERVQQVFGIKIKLNSAGGKLRAGMTVVAHLDLDRGQG